MICFDVGMFFLFKSCIIEWDIDEILVNFLSKNFLNLKIVFFKCFDLIIFKLNVVFILKFWMCSIDLVLYNLFVISVFMLLKIGGLIYIIIFGC